LKKGKDYSRIKLPKISIHERPVEAIKKARLRDKVKIRIGGGQIEKGGGTLGLYEARSRLETF
jgi:hypothetical protein